MERKEEVKCGAAAMSLQADVSCLQGGGAEGEAALAPLEKQLICPICLELFSKPVVILPCQHNLCRKCANELYQPSLFQARTTMLVNSGRFRCPSCRHEVVLDRHGVYGLQRNLLVENIIDVYKQEVSNNNNNAMTAPPPLAPPAQVTCPDHEGEKVNIYCLTCQVPTCSLCKVFGAHQSCQVAPLTDVYQQQKGVLSEEVSSLVTVNNKYQAVIDELEESCRNIEENCKTQKQNVCDKFNRVFAILEERRKAMTQQISSEQEEKTGHSQALVRCYGDIVAANSKLMERAASSMDESDMAAFVQNSRELIKTVIAASSSCPTETLKPGFKSMSHYRFDFSRQERALRSIDFLKVVADVPEELEVEQVPEEPTESSVQTLEANHPEETSSHNLGSVIEAVKEQSPSPPVEPAQTAAPSAVPLPPAPHLVMDSVEPAGPVQQPEADELDSNSGGSVVTKDENEEEKVEAEGCAAADAVKEGNICEHQEGMSTQQCEGGEPEGKAGDPTAQNKTKDKRDAHDEEEDMQMKEGADATFYASRYEPDKWCRVSSAAAGFPSKDHHTEQTLHPPPPAGDSHSEAGTPTEAQGAVQAMSEPQTQPQSLWSLNSQSQEQSLSHSNQPPPEPQLLPLSSDVHAQPYLPLPQVPHHPTHQSQPLSSPQESLKVPDELSSAFTPVPRLTLTQQEAAGEAAVREEDSEEEEDMQGWVCLPGDVDKRVSPVEGSFDLGGGSSGSFADSYHSPSSTPAEENVSGPERGSSEIDKDNVRFSEENIEGADEKRQHDEDGLDLKWTSELKDRGLLEADFEGRMVIEGQGNDLPGLERDDGSKPNTNDLDGGGHGVECTDSVIQGDGEAELEADSSEFTARDEEDGENREPCEDFNKMETSVAEDKITSSVSLQAVTLLFYLLAFLVILQRVWAYIGCFICT